jgi:hypothetical protein
VCDVLAVEIDAVVLSHLHAMAGPGCGW